ncbi:homospermidine synthase [Pseudenhygromyxa sp. WMMC2535]|uniref:homospermidine synthase n=1 Tax=Pseudenhygromyxa sp. WMMC2535 TaxID=2712867 RepID=UPI00155274A6|nr:homospermidine synthase [Pseudenhygromyxa sp. WMMC2535]NVB42338.1 homospermidine synthase [Pseudenhygromyxa sp. WMMC2535]
MGAAPDRAANAGRRILILGAAGGVASATLALLERHPRGRALLGAGDQLLLVDDNVPNADDDLRALPRPANARWLPPQRVDTGEDLAALVREHRVDEVLEFAEVGTWACVEACASEGASYLSTAYDVWPAEAPPGSPRAQTMIRARELFDPPDVHAGVHLVCMGMNPGLINLVVAAGMRELAERSGRAPSLIDLDLHAILFTEVDSTTTEGPLPPADERFACTWSPWSCLTELLEDHSMITVDGESRSLAHRPHEARYQARCGHEQIEGFLVPHEELVTLGAMYPLVELGYIYRLPPAAMASLRQVPERGPEQWPTARLYPPARSDLRGSNRLGALLCSRSLGELWIGWDTPVERALPLGTNATLLQVAAGVVAGWTLARELEPGIWLPEELDSQRLLALAQELLGPLEVIWDPHAPARALSERRV